MFIRYYWTFQPYLSNPIISFHPYLIRFWPLVSINPGHGQTKDKILCRIFLDLNLQPGYFNINSLLSIFFSVNIYSISISYHQELFQCPNENFCSFLFSVVGSVWFADFWILLLEESQPLYKKMTYAICHNLQPISKNSIKRVVNLPYYCIINIWLDT